MRSDFVRTLISFVAMAIIAMPLAALAQSAKPAAKPPAAPSIGGATPHLLGQYGDWAAYSAAPGNRPVCFALTRPTSSQTNPQNRRDESMAVYLFISTRPKEKVKDEVSILVTRVAMRR